MFDEMPGEEWIVMVAGGEELGEDLGEMGRGVDEGDEGVDDRWRVLFLLVGFC